MTDFVHFRVDSGEIVGMGTAPEAYVAAQKQPDCDVLVVEGKSDYRATHYVADPGGTPTLTPLQAMGASASAITVPADGVTAITVSGLPDPVSLQVTGPVPAAAEVTGGSVDLTFDEPGAYTLRFTRVSYLPFTVTIDAT